MGMMEVVQQPCERNYVSKYAMFVVVSDQVFQAKRADRPSATSSVIFKTIQITLDVPSKMELEKIRNDSSQQRFGTAFRMASTYVFKNIYKNYVILTASPKKAPDALR